MKIGDLFLLLSVKGGDKSKKDVSNIGDALGSLSLKAVAVHEAFKRAYSSIQGLVSKSLDTGTQYKNFEALTGMGPKLAQQYSWAAKQVGISNEQLLSSFSTLQKKVADTLMGTAPAGLERFNEVMGKVMSENEFIELMDKPEALLQKLQEYSKLEKNIGLRNVVLDSFGMDDGMKSALAREAFTPQTLAKAPAFSSGEINQLDKINAKWKNLGDRWDMMIGKLNAKHGDKLVAGFEKISAALAKVVESLVTLANETKLFEMIEKLLTISSNVIAATPEAAGKTIDFLKGDSLITGPMDYINEVFGNLMGKFVNTDAAKGIKKLEGQYGIPDGSSGSGYLNKTAPSPSGSGYLNKTAPSPKPVPRPSEKATIENSSLEKNNQINVSQTLNFSHPGENAGAVADASKQAVQQAFRNLSAIGRAG